jgi:hypothetical protein
MVAHSAPSAFRTVRIPHLHTVNRIGIGGVEKHRAGKVVFRNTGSCGSGQLSAVLCVVLTRHRKARRSLYFWSCLTFCSPQPAHSNSSRLAM